jgi:DNA-binding Lrp family transcriptional regulator
MPSRAREIQRAQTSLAPALPLGRASAQFVLDISRISRGDGDLLRPLLMTVILEANQALINQDPGLQLAYGDLGTAAPDELRRPVSVRAVAESLRLPFETVRRRVHALGRAGLCVHGPHGVYVPHAVVTSEAYNAVQLARYERLQTFHRTAVGLGVVAAPAPPEGPPQDPPPVRAANRAIAEYVLRVSDRTMGLTGGVLAGAVFLELACANLADLEDADFDGARFAGRMVPVPTLRLSRRLGLAAETTRRHVMALQARGYCRREARGLTATVPDAARPRLAAVLAENVANVQRLFARLDQLGVRAHW